MSKYPFVYFLRDDKYKEIDELFTKNREQLQCTVEIISLEEVEKLNNMFNPNYHLVITFGEDEAVYSRKIQSIIANRMRNRWIHKNKINNIEEFNRNVNYCYIHNVISDRESTRPEFSVFTSCYKSYEKILRAYNGMTSQTLKDWEWVLMDDSPEDDHFDYLRTQFKGDKRVRLYKRDANSANIGNVKNETVSLCRGKYILELDHDDIILPTLLKDAYSTFESDNEIGFVYADYANVYENWNNFSYGDFFGKGYCGYYKYKWNNRWLNVCSNPGINNITTSHLVCLPNHPRIWRRKTLMELGNYSEFLPICDDFEILLRTMTKTKVAKIHKLGYIQFMNDGNNNFSLIWNDEINRLGPQWIRSLFYDNYKVNEVMKEKDAYEDEKYITQHSQIWKRKNWIHKKCNITVNPDYDKQYCLLGLKSLYDKRIKELYGNPRNDFILLENTVSSDMLITELENNGYDRMKCYGLEETTFEELENYFHLICKYTDNYEIIKNESIRKPIYSSRERVINKYVNENSSYLEIGVEYGETFEAIVTENKVGVDPDPKTSNSKIIKKTSDDFFAENKETFDIIFIDGMHQSDYMLRDLINSIECINKNGIIFIDDILPISEREQFKVPIKHKYENGILKYGEPWTGDIWKVVYYMLKNHKENVEYEVFEHKNYRGVGKFQFKDKIQIPSSSITEIESYDYKEEFSKYKAILMNNNNEQL